MEKMELPNGWVKTYLTEVSHPKQYKTIAIKDLLEKGFLVYGANGIIGFYDQYTHSDATVLITCRGANCGNIHLSEPYSYINGNAMALDGISEDIINRGFILYALKSRGFRDIISGSAQPQITREGLTKCDLNLAPLAEQKEIVRIIESHLQLVDQIKSRLEALPKILEQFRQSVLASAVSGKFTEGWGDYERKNIDIKLESIISNIRYGTSKKCTDLAVGTPVLRIPNIKQGKIDLQELKYAEFSESELENFSLKVGDILLIRSNGSVDLVGQIGVVDERSTKCLFAGYLIRIRLNATKALSHYIALCLQSPVLRNSIEQTARSTSGVNNLNSQEVQDLVVPLPTIEEQKEIVKRVENLFMLADQIESKIKNAQERVNLLTQSILAKAFRGEFTAKWREDNPNLISGENSAEALLKQIEEAKKAAKKKK